MPIQGCGDGLIFHNGARVAAIENRSMGCALVQWFGEEKTIMDPIDLESTLPLYLPTSALSMEAETSADGVVVLAVPKRRLHLGFQRR